MQKPITQTTSHIMKKICLSVFVAYITGCATNNSHIDTIGSISGISIVTNSVKSQRVNNLLKAQAILHNDSRSAITGYYRCTFTNANAMLVGDSQLWQSVTIYPKGNQAIYCNATDPEATDFKFEFSQDASNVSAINN